MASGGGSRPSVLGRPPSSHPPSSSLPSGRSWANIVNGRSGDQIPEFSPLFQKESFDKLKGQDHAYVPVDEDFRSRAIMRMSACLYGKFLGKALPLEQFKVALKDIWGSFGTFSVADMPNGFYFISCESPEMANILLCEGPWTISGLVLQLSPWRENFQPAFERLSLAAVWIQIHHLPMELWHSEYLESIAESLGRLLKVDELTLNVSRAKFARICVEIDLSKPLHRAVWVGPPGNKALAVIVYERIPVFCFHCGCIGHSSAVCSSAGSNRHPLPPDPGAPSPGGPVSGEQSMVVDEVPSEGVTADEVGFGPWMTVQRKGKRGSGRSPVQPRGESTGPATWTPSSSHARQLAVSSRGGSSRGRGVSNGHFSGRSGSSSFRDPSSFQHSDSRGFEKPFEFSVGSVPTSFQFGLGQSSLSNPNVSPSSSTLFPKASFAEKGKAPLGPSLVSVSLSSGPLSPSQLLLPPPSPPDPSPPLLMSSVLSLSPVSVPCPPVALEGSSCPPSGPHEALVSRVALALCPPPGGGGSFIGESGSLDESSELAPSEPDDEMSLDSFQNLTKIEALARRDLSLHPSRPKKGRKSLPS